MKILIVSNDSAGLINFRGLLLREMIKLGHEVACVVPEETTGYKANEKLEELGCKSFFSKIERRSLNPIKDICLLVRYKKIFETWKPQLVITYTIKPNIYGGMVCRLLGIPYVANVTGLGSAFQKEGFLKKIVIEMYKIAMKKVQIVFFENIENRDILVSNHVIELDKTYVLAGAGVDLEKFRYLEYPPKQSVTRFLFIGRVMREKGIEELLGALGRLNLKNKCCTLDILGDFEENYSERLRKYEEKGWVRYHGIQPDIRPFVKHSHCFVLPSWHEGMANTNLENAASGRPIITTRIHGCLEAVIDGKTGYLCDCKNVDSLCEAMERFIDIPYEKKREMGIEGRKHMENVFDKRKVVIETLNIIENVLIGV